MLSVSGWGEAGVGVGRKGPHQPGEKETSVMRILWRPGLRT